MAKLNKMELQAVAGSILKQVREAKLPSLSKNGSRKPLKQNPQKCIKNFKLG